MIRNNGSDADDNLSKERGKGIKGGQVERGNSFQLNAVVKTINEFSTSEQKDCVALCLTWVEFLFECPRTQRDVLLLLAKLIPNLVVVARGERLKKDVTCSHTALKLIKKALNLAIDNKELLEYEQLVPVLIAFVKYPTNDNEAGILQVILHYLYKIIDKIPWHMLPICLQATLVVEGKNMGDQQSPVTSPNSSVHGVGRLDNNRSEFGSATKNETGNNLIISSYPVIKPEKEGFVGTNTTSLSTDQTQYNPDGKHDARNPVNVSKVTHALLVSISEKTDRLKKALIERSLDHCEETKNQPMNNFDRQLIEAMLGSISSNNKHERGAALSVLETIILHVPKFGIGRRIYKPLLARFLSNAQDDEITQIGNVLAATVLKLRRKCNLNKVSDGTSEEMESIEEDIDSYSSFRENEEEVNSILSAKDDNDSDKFTSVEVENNFQKDKKQGIYEKEEQNTNEEVRRLEEIHVEKEEKILKVTGQQKTGIVQEDKQGSRSLLPGLARREVDKWWWTITKPLLLAINTDDSLIKKLVIFLTCTASKCGDTWSAKQMALSILKLKVPKQRKERLSEALTKVVFTREEYKRLRMQLNTKQMDESTISLFSEVFSLNPISQLMILLLMGKYEQCAKILEERVAKLELSPAFVSGLENLVDTLESQVFSHVRFDLTNVGQKSAYLQKFLYGVLAILPQNNSFIFLARRLQALTPIINVSLKHYGEWNEYTQNNNDSNQNRTNKNSDGINIHEISAPQYDF